MRSTVAALALGAAALAQTINPSSSAVIRDARALLPAEVAQVLEAARQAAAGKAFRAAYVPGGPGIDYVMRADGRPEWMRTASGADSISEIVGPGQRALVPRAEHIDLLDIVHYTGTPARSCDGSPLAGELVIEYERKTPPGAWTVRARTRGDIEPGGPIFDMLAGARTLEPGEIRDVDGRRARAFVAPWVAPANSTGGPMGAPQSLWIDVESLLPTRWSLSLKPPADVALPANVEYGMSFTYDASIDVRPPDGVAVPDCVR